MVYRIFILSMVIFLISYVKCTDFKNDFAEYSNGSNYVAVNLVNVTLRIDSLSGNTIHIMQVPNPNTGGSGKGNENCSASGVYWRPWTGDIPEDAIIGGYDVTASGDQIPVYLGQVLLLYVNTGVTPSKIGGLQPVRIYKDSYNVTASFWGLHTKTDNVNILCSSNPTSVSWIPSIEAYLPSVRRNWVLAGAENSYSLHFGRVTYGGHLIIGKIAGPKMYFPFNNREITITDNSFEVLAYTSDRKNPQEEDLTPAPA